MICGAHFFPPSQGGSGRQPLERVRPAYTRLLSLPGCGWESGSCSDLPPIILPPQDGRTCRSIFFQWKESGQAQLEVLERKRSVFGPLHSSLPFFSPSLLLPGCSLLLRPQIPSLLLQKKKRFSLSVNH